MAWVLLVAVGLLGLAVLGLAVLAVRLRRRLADLESRWSSSDPIRRSETPDRLPLGSLDADRPEYVITRIGEPEPDPVSGQVPQVGATLFTDILLKETVVQAASLAHGLRRALAPETRNRIRFHVRAEVKRSRKQRRAELRDVRREWAARRRTEMAAEDPAA